MFTFTRTRAVMLALAQVWLIVMGALFVRLTMRVLEDARIEAPWPTFILLHSSVALLALPLLWISFALFLQTHSDISENQKVIAYLIGWLLLGFLILFVGYALVQPWRVPRANQGLIADP